MARNPAIQTAPSVKDRPKCLDCGRPLRPHYQTKTTRVRQLVTRHTPPDEKDYSWTHESETLWTKVVFIDKIQSRTWNGKYGDMDEGFFCGTICGYRYGRTLAHALSPSGKYELKERVRFMKCGICKKTLNVPTDPLSYDCGGDCSECMADAGDIDVIAHLHSIGFATFLPLCTVVRAYVAATCPQCGLKGKVGVSTNQIIHKTMLCVTCTEANEAQTDNVDDSTPTGDEDNDAGFVAFCQEESEL